MTRRWRQASLTGFAAPNCLYAAQAPELKAEVDILFGKCATHEQQEKEHMARVKQMEDQVVGPTLSKHCTRLGLSPCFSSRSSTRLQALAYCRRVLRLLSAHRPCAGWIAPCARKCCRRSVRPLLFPSCLSITGHFGSDAVSRSRQARPQHQSDAITANTRKQQYHTTRRSELETGALSTVVYHSS